MNISAEFKHGMCQVTISPSDDWERKLLGAIAKGGNTLSAQVEYKFDGHFSHGDCEVVHILLCAAKGPEDIK
jgi:hypothetical protein